jgi:hypothetical protein
MNRSYSKIRHILQANLMLEGRMMSEKRILLEEDKKEGDIVASPRDPSEIATGMIDAPFNVINSNGQYGKQYYYTCVSNKDLPLDKQTPAEKAGAIVDGNNNLVTAAGLGLIPGYQNKLNVACKPIYDNLAKWRKTFCANLKNKTKPNYAWNCPEAAKPVVAAAVTTATPEEYINLYNSNSLKSNPKIVQLIKDGNITVIDKENVSDNGMERTYELRYFTTGKTFTLGQGTGQDKVINSPKGTDITDLVVSLTK